MINLLRDLEGAKSALGLMEGARWIECQFEDWYESPYGLKSALAWLEEKPKGNHEVYGDGGMNRYFVRPNGDVLFSRHHACYPREKTVMEAEELGFEVL